MADKLALLKRLRHEAVLADRARLAAAIAALDDAEAACTATRTALRRETDEAARLDRGDEAVIAFAAWLPHGRAAIAAAEERLAQATLAASRARAALSLSRAAERAVIELITSRADARARDQATRAQTALDDITLSRRRSG